LKRLVLREAHVQPVLAVFEDLHWIDSETQAVLDGLVESVPTARLLLLVNYRPEYQHGWSGKTYYTQLRLDPLTPEGAGEMLQATLGADPSLGPLKTLLVERTEGNPLFLEEIARTLVETGVVVGTQGTYRLAGSLQDIQVPATVQAVLAARIDRLGADDKRLLQVASVIGKDVPLDLLQVVAELPEADLRQRLARLQAAEFMYETGLFPGPEYTFRHALTLEAAYQSLLRSIRQQYHQRIAGVLEERFPHTAESKPEVLAHHYTQAGLSDLAVPYWLAAGTRAAERSAHAEAIDYLTRGLELFRSLPDAEARPYSELEFQTRLGPALAATRGYAAPEVTRTYVRARELCRAVGATTPQVFPALWGLWETYLVRSELESARELGEQLVALAREVDDPALLLVAHDALGVTYQLLGAPAAARTHLEHAIALYRVDHHRSMAQLYGQEDPGTTCRAFLAKGLWLLGYPAQALEQMREAFALAQELAHPPSLAQLLAHAAFFYQFRREPQTVQQHAEAAIALCSEQGFAYYLAYGTIMRGWALAAQGRAEEGIDQMRRGIDALEATGAFLRQPYYLAMLAEAHGERGEGARGLELLAQARAASHRSGGSYWEAEIDRIEGELLLRDGRDAEAEARFESAAAVGRRQEARSLELRAAMSLSRLWKRQGKAQVAHGRLEPILAEFTEAFDTADLREARQLLAELS
jgi:predicted ATPase